MNVTVVNFASNRSNGINDYSDPTKNNQNVRAATANNQHRKPRLVEAFKSPRGFKSSISVNKGAQILKVAGYNRNDRNMSPNTTENQQRLMQKL